MPRKLVVSNLMSLDGYITAPEGGPPIPADQNFDPQPFNEYNLERLQAASTLLTGRKTYEMFVGYWPLVAEDATADPASREISRINNGIEKVVVSDSLTPEQTGPWRDSTRIL